MRSTPPNRELPMRDNLSEGCPTAVDLRAYSQMQSDGATVSDALRRHIENCIHCKSVLRELPKEGHSPGTPPVMNEALNRLVDQQREYLGTMMTWRDRVPKAGEIWATRRHSSVSNSPSQPLIAFLVLVLRSFVREYTGTVVTDVAPVTDDPWLAADWSVIFDSEQSGIGTTVVAHLDTQVTTTANHLQRYVGSLAEHAFADLATVLRAYDCAEPPPSDLKVGRMGQAATRRLAAWCSLARELDHLISHLVVLVVDEAEDDTAATEPTLSGGLSVPTGPDDLSGTPAALGEGGHWIDSKRDFHLTGRYDSPRRKVAEGSHRSLGSVTVAAIVQYCFEKGRANKLCTDLDKLLKEKPVLRQHLSKCFIDLRSRDWPLVFRNHMAQVPNVDDSLERFLLMTLAKAKHVCENELEQGDTIQSRAARSARPDKQK